MLSFHPCPLHDSFCTFIKINWLLWDWKKFKNREPNSGQILASFFNYLNIEPNYKKMPKKVEVAARACEWAGSGSESEWQRARKVKAYSVALRDYTRLSPLDTVSNNLNFIPGASDLSDADSSLLYIIETENLALMRKFRSVRPPVGSEWMYEISSKR